MSEWMGGPGMSLDEIVAGAEMALRLAGCLKVVCPGRDPDDRLVGLMAVHYGAARAGMLGTGQVRVIRRWYEDGHFEALVMILPPSPADPWCQDGSLPE